MKKRYLFGLLIITIILLFNKKEEKTSLVNATLVSNMNYKQVLIMKDNLTTNNFNDLFKNIRVLSVYPYIDKIYEDKIKYVYQYNSIDDFKKRYIRYLENIGYYSVSNKYLYSPIKIEKVLIYIEMNSLSEVFKEYELESCLDTYFYCVKLK